MAQDGSVAVDIPTGPSLKDHPNRVSEKDKVMKLLPVDVEKEYFGLSYFPLVLPLRRSDFVPEGSIASKLAVEAISVLFPFAKC